MSHITPDELNSAAEGFLKELQARTEPLKPKDRMQIPGQDMPSQDPDVRRGNTSEVALGYTPAQAMLEAQRCLRCKRQPCIKGCPVAIDIRDFVEAIADGDNAKAISVIKQSSLLPAICGRVCPQEVQCQAECTLGKGLRDPEKSVSIGRLERYVADWEREAGQIGTPEVKASTGKKVAVIGSGPAGLVVAADVRREGHDVTVFEAFHKFGGVMLYGIPEFRLPKAIVGLEIETLQKMGVQMVPNFVVGRTRKLQDLLAKDGFDAVFVGTGAGLPKFMGIDGENLVGVFSANEYLTRANLMRAYEKGKAATPIVSSRRVAVLGGGNVAMDAARTALRLGAEEVHLIYRRTEKEMPARVEEVGHAKEEGVQFHILQNVKQIIGDEHGCVKQAELLRYELGEPDDSGRRRPVVIEGSEFLMDLDTVIVAIGNSSNPLIKQTTPEIEATSWGTLVADESGKTSMDRVYAGGDIVLGAATVILAMGQGRQAAASINTLLASES
ncbi:MAG: NADPH-dependent glutamate synthase [Lentisphaerae bacterium]|jgi:glutamate synthase (NADPH) small chain|nr:NADPH-dependent glutamate synthase [Lentisphaerota bacterium]MBT4818770.1 NADPH-dependent glutamate synthase [Lentisphaerota bacterium]MBT5606305.1 NADPH-dependent glutamate synthase [Lentisphaerota bacterium]MBT7059355.1 NADPH-dependent glutamate synthase [Lentisphaerota bacterium]MBT7848250.1 NADPH-dependent glutamate synthase [Lentisphaerota bacterium]